MVRYDNIRFSMIIAESVKVISVIQLLNSFIIPIIILKNKCIFVKKHFHKSVRPESNLLPVPGLRVMKYIYKVERFLKTVYTHMLNEVIISV